MSIEDFKLEINKILNSVELPNEYIERNDKDELMARAKIEQLKTEIRKLAMAPIQNSEKISYLEDIIFSIIEKFPELSKIYVKA